MNDTPSKVALYWDFENVHALLANKTHGENAYRDNRFSIQPVFVELAPVIDYAASLGDVVINRAYGNWQWFSNYRDSLNQFGIDLIQLFPRGTNMKNSADIRMALDVLSDIHQFRHISHVVIVSSDSDFISLAQKIKQTGKTVVGVGIEGFSNRFWVSSCNEFKFYESLHELAKTTVTLSRVDDPTAPETISGNSVATLTLDEGHSALLTAMTQLVDRNGDNYVACAQLKHVIKRLLPAFDERSLGCANFTAFLRKCADIVTLVDTQSGGHVALVSLLSEHEAESTTSNTGLVFDGQPMPVE